MTAKTAQPKGRMVLVTIGWQHLLLPDDTGVAALMKMLQKAEFVSDQRYGKRPRLVMDTDPVRLQTEYVKRDVRLVTKAQAEREDEADELAKPRKALEQKPKTLFLEGPSR